MHIVLYTFNRHRGRADEFCASMRALGHTVDERNAKYFDGVVIPCDRVVLEWEAVGRVEKVYRRAGIEVEVIGAPSWVGVPDDIPPRTKSWHS